MIGVSGVSRGFRTAVAELPLRARAVDEVRGAVAIIDGAPGWAQRSRIALADGAVALIVADPIAEDDDEIAALHVAAGAAPIVLERPWLRADVAADAGGYGAARQVTADAVAVASELGTLVREAVGWLRVLAEGDLELRAVAATPHGVLALLDEPASGRAAAMTASALIGGGGARVRAHAVGETRIEVDIDSATDLRSVVVATADGVMQRPKRWESGERLALRRALDALATGGCPTDLGGFRHDCALAARIGTAG